MSKVVKRAVAVILCLILFSGTVAIGGEGLAEVLESLSVKAHASINYSVGDVIEFGNYPQTDVTASIGSILNSKAINWQSYEYFEGKGNRYSSMHASDYMYYCDVKYGNYKYRGVTFDTYRPFFTGETSSADTDCSYQDDNGYEPENIYWFKYEPLKWRILDPTTGLVICETIIDSQPYNNYLYSNIKNGVVGYFSDSAYTNRASDYATSSIREWLNNVFYTAAFTQSQQSMLKTSFLNNDAYWTLQGVSGHEDYDSASTSDKVFLLSYDEVLNSNYGFSKDDDECDSARQAKGSDYAKCQGLRVFNSSGNSYDGCSYWLLRSPGFRADCSCNVTHDGLDRGSASTYETINGIRPALKLQDLKSDSSYGPEGAEMSQDFSVMSYNVYVENGNVKDGADSGKKYDCSYATRSNYIINNIMNEMPDSVGFQEVTAGMRAYFEDNLTTDLNSRNMAQYYTAIGEYRGGKGNNEGSLIAYRKDKYNLKASGTRWYSGKKGAKQEKADKYTRIYTYALLESKESKQQYLHINTHLSHVDAAATESVAQLIYFVNHSYPDIPVVITGDFNHTNAADAYKNLVSAGFVDANSGNTAKTYTNCYNQLNDEGNVMTPKIIDFIFVRNGFSAKEYSVIDEDYSNTSKYGSKALAYPYPSDHHPITASLTYSYYDTAVNSSVSYKVNGNTVNNSVKYDGKWLGYDNKHYNHDLARFCSEFAMMGYLNNKTELSQNLAKFGFGNAEIDLETGQKENPGRDEVNYFIADKKENINGEEYTFVFAGFIGSNGYQWYSNFDPNGTQRKHSYAGNSEKGKVHLGFADARDFAIGKLQAHINNLNVDKSKLKLIITGHSRGAATANLVSAKILDGTGLCYGSNLYTYTFATPNVVNQRADGVNIYAEKYKCIFNIVNPEDFVTKVLLSDWGFGRYGVTYTLPSKTNDNNYEKYYLSKMRPEFNKYTGQTYVPYTRGEKSTYSIVKTMSSEVKTLSQLYDNKYPVGLTHVSSPFQFFKYALIPLVSGKEASGDDYVDTFELLGRIVATPGAQLYREIAGFFIDITRLSDITGILKQFIKDRNVEKLKDSVPELLNFTRAHQMETYCAYMNTMSSASLTYYREAYKNTVNCPVDIEVYDNYTGELVGRIKNNVVDEAVAAKEGSVVMNVDGDSKEFWLPSNGNYRVVLTGNDNGIMDYTVSQIDSDTGEVERVNFFDVDIKNGKSYEGDFSKTYDTLEDYILTDENGNEIESTEVILDKKQLYNVNIKVEGAGFATESQTAVSGDYIVLTAEAQEGIKFLGWFEKDKLVSGEKDFSFVAKSDRDITAKFESKPYTLTYDANGGKGAPAPRTGGERITLSNVKPTREGYKFLGWGLTETASDLWQPGDVFFFILKRDTTIYAVWEKDDSSANPTAKAKLYTGNSTTITVWSNVTVVAKADNVPKGYKLVVCDKNNKVLKEGDNKSVSYNAGAISSDTVFNIHVVDEKGNIMSSDAGELSKTIEVKTSGGFFAWLFGFLFNLFGITSGGEVIEP